jgi:MFS family permease
MIVLRVAQGSGYVGMATVGAAMLLEPSRMVTGQMGDTMGIIWAMMMVAGGILGALAMITRHWTFETLGLPLLWSATPMWALAYLRQLPYTSGRFAAGVFLLAVTCFLFAHWRLVYKFGNDSIEARLLEKRSTNGKH